MEKFILIGIGLLALGYIFRVVWSGLNGKTACNCGSACSDKGCASSRELCKKK